MNTCADDARVAFPLFQAEYGGSIPTSALHLRFSRMSLRKALELNAKWHSRLPKLPFDTVNMKHGFAYGAECGNVFYAVAIWSTPVSRVLDDGTRIELRRMAIADDAPKNTASRMLGWMVRELKRESRWKQAVSYQDTAVHNGTIYRASGWLPSRAKCKGHTWQTGKKGNWKRFGASGPDQSLADKVRWEMNLDTSNEELTLRNGANRNGGSIQ